MTQKYKEQAEVKRDGVINLVMEVDLGAWKLWSNLYFLEFILHL